MIDFDYNFFSYFLNAYLLLALLDRYEPINEFLPKNPWVYYISAPILAGALIFIINFFNFAISPKVTANIALFIGISAGILRRKAERYGSKKLSVVN